MSEKNKKEEIEAEFAKSIDALNDLRGKVKAFILLASTDEPSEGKEDAVRGVNAVYGKMCNLVALHDNISPDIKSASVLVNMVEILGKVFGENEESESEKGRRETTSPSQHR